MTSDYGTVLTNIDFQVQLVGAYPNTSAVALRVVRGDEKGTWWLGRKLATLYPGDTITGTWLAGWGNLESETVKYYDVFNGC
jgi:hypothetical protein